MIKTVCLLALAGLASCQYQNDPRNAAIIQEQRYLSADGKFGASYSQEDGVQFKEEADPDGTRRGTYSYVDPNGQRKTVSYTAGKFGFQATGDHIPALPAPYTPEPQYQSPQYQQPQYQPQPQYQQPQPNYNRPAPQPQPTYNNNPQPAYRPAPPQPQPAYNPPPTYTTTPAPHRFYPPGKLNLNRSPDGFSYTFSKS